MTAESSIDLPALPMFVAEVSSNHARDLERCSEFIRTTADIGAHAVKFQLFRVDALFAPEILAASAPHRAREAWELPVAFLSPIADMCREARIEFIITPFDLAAVEQSAPYVDRFKISSYELLWPDLIKACAATGKPLIISTGMADEAEIANAVEVYKSAGGADLTLLHCVSSYPMPAADANLSAISTLSTAFGLPVGWSDHSRDPAIITRAVHRFGATTIEFHLDLDGEGAEFPSGHCWLPEEIRPVIAACLVDAEADGDGRKVAMPSELPDRDWRADPEDGLRPLKSVRKTYHG